MLCRAYETERPFFGGGMFAEGDSGNSEREGGRERLGVVGIMGLMGRHFSRNRCNSSGTDARRSVR